MRLGFGVFLQKLGESVGAGGLHQRLCRTWQGVVPAKKCWGLKRGCVHPEIGRKHYFFKWVSVNAGLSWPPYTHAVFYPQSPQDGSGWHR